MADAFVKLTVGEKRTYFADTKFWSIERTGKTSTQVLYGANGQGKRITNHGYHTEGQMTSLIKSKLRKGYMLWTDPLIKGVPASNLVVGNMYLISPIVSPETEHLWPTIIACNAAPDIVRWHRGSVDLSNEHVISLGRVTNIPYRQISNIQKVLYKESILHLDIPRECYLEPV